MKKYALALLMSASILTAACFPEGMDGRQQTVATFVEAKLGDFNPEFAENYDIAMLKLALRVGEPASAKAVARVADIIANLNPASTRDHSELLDLASNMHIAYHEMTGFIQAKLGQFEPAHAENYDINFLKVALKIRCGSVDDIEPATIIKSIVGNLNPANAGDHSELLDLALDHQVSAVAEVTRFVEAKLGQFEPAHAENYDIRTLKLALRVGEPTTAKAVTIIQNIIANLNPASITDHSELLDLALELHNK